MINQVRIKNKKAAFEYFLLEKYVAGIMLTGTEIKSIRDSNASIAEAYCLFVNDELFIRNMHIAEYSFGTCNNHVPRRDRKLLLKSRELKKLNNKLKEQGTTLIPTLLFINEKGLAKLEIALAKGKDIQREMDRGKK